MLQQEIQEEVKAHLIDTYSNSTFGKTSSTISEEVLSGCGSQSIWTVTALSRIYSNLDPHGAESGRRSCKKC
jgi:hypothetical protein